MLYFNVNDMLMSSTARVQVDETVIWSHVHTEDQGSENWNRPSQASPSGVYNSW